MKELTDTQRRVLDAIREQTKMQGYPPSLRELMGELGLQSTNGVRGHLKALEKKGYLNLGTYGLSRQITSTEPFISVPVVGKIAAGNPILAHENNEESLCIGRDFGDTDGTFVMVVADDSVSGSGMLVGDHLVVREGGRLEPGDLGVIQMDGKSVIRRCYCNKEGERKLFLEKASGIEEDTELQNYQIRGKVIGLLRKYS